MQPEPAPARSSGTQQDPPLPRTSTMPPPESPSEARQPSPDHSPAEVLRVWEVGLGFAHWLRREER